MQNPVLEYDSMEGKKDIEVSKTEAMDKKEAEESDFDLREKVKEAEYDDISYKQWEYSKDNDQTSFEQFVSKEETLEDSLLLQLTFSKLKGQQLKIGRYLVEAIDDNGYLKPEVLEILDLIRSVSHRKGTGCHSDI